MKNVYLSLGANLGDRSKNIWRAIEKIREHDKIKLIRLSSMYETEPWGVDNQPKFINAAAWIQTDLEPIELLDSTQKIEREFGFHEHNQARMIDIDILEFEGVKIESDRLTLPHRFMNQRRFVLEPLIEICPLKKFLLENCSDSLEVKKLPSIEFVLIACVDQNWGIGFENDLLFRIPRDLHRFREMTIDQNVIMGRKTFESIGKFLPDRNNFVLSRSGLKVEDLFEKLDRSKKNFVIGGSEIFWEFLPITSRAEIAFVHETRIADKFLENLFEREDFKLISRKNFHDDFIFEFLTFIRN